MTMIRLVAWSARHPRLVLATALAVLLAGVVARRALRRDAIPDLSEPQIVLVVDWMDHAAPEVARRITDVLTGALASVPGATAVRGTSMSGMAYVDVVFAAPRELAPGRDEIARRVRAAELPNTARVQLGQTASSTGWVFEYALVNRGRRSSLLELRRLQDEVVGPALAAIPGVAEVAPLGGEVQQLSVEASPDRLRARGLAFSDVVAALRTEPARAALDEAALARVRALPLPAGILSDVAFVRLAPDLPSGFADVGGAALAVGGVVVADRDANVPALLTEARRRLSEARARLPTGVDVVITYDRGELIAGVDRTLVRALAEEIAVVAGVILLFLMHGRSALVPLLTLPVVLAATFVAMRLFDVPASIMTMGGMGIALGIAVDADVVALEACHRRLEALPAETAPTARRAHLVSAAAAFVPAVTTSLLITALSFLPVFAFTGEAGRLLRPLALAKTLVIGASALVALTVAPALRATLLRDRVRAEFDSPLNRGLVRAYRPFVRFALERPALTLATAALAVVSCLPLVPRLGREFLPRLDEGELLFMPTTLPGAPPLLARNQLLAQDRAIASFAEVDTVFGKIGRADTGTDPAPFTMAETIVRLRPRAEWPRRPRARWYSSWAPGLLRWVLRLAWPEEVPLTTAELVEHLDRATRLPGWTNAWTTPARARMDMMATGFRTPLGLRVVADTPEGLDALGAAVQRALARTEGARSVVYESLGGETRLAFEADAAALDARDVDAHVAADAADLVTNGGQLADAGRDGRAVRARVHPALLDGMRGDADQLRDVTVRARDGQPVPLALVGRPAYRSVPAALRSEGGRLVGYVHIDLAENADVAGFVARGRRALEGLALGPGERLEWAGQFPLLAAGERRLAWIVPLVAFSMLGLLFLQFRSLTASLIVLAAVPFALVGSVWALHLAGYPLSAPVWVGLLSVLGLAMQTGVVMVVYIDDAFYRRVARGELTTRADIVAAHAEGTVQRLRPKLMTVTTMAAALVPLAWAEGPGSEILRRVAAPMLGGLVTSTFLTLEVLPVLYTMWRYAQLRRGQRLGVPLATIVGSRPTWASESVMLRE